MSKTGHFLTSLRHSSILNTLNVKCPVERGWKEISKLTGGQFRNR